MNNVLSRNVVNAKDFILVRENGIVYQVEKPVFCSLKQYSEQEYARLLRLNPSFLANDAKNYKDPIYVRNICRVYAEISGRAVISILEIKRFYIADLEKALFKLKKNYPTEYDILCKDYCINPEKKASTSAVINWDNCSNIPILRLTHWGYAEVFSPNTKDFVERIAEKTYSTANLSDVEKAKWAHLFFIFVRGFNHMPYEDDSVEKSIVETEKLNGGVKITAKEEQEIINQVVEDFMKVESDSLLSAITLNYTYTMFFSKLDNSSINLDMVKYFVYSIVGTEYRLQMLNLVDLLSSEEQAEFHQNNVQALKNNAEVRILKEKLFARGTWASGMNSFLTNPDKKVKKAMIAADVKYVAEDFKFGKNVESYKTKHTVFHYTTNRKAQLPGYLYASAPIRLRISDPNEIRMIHFYFATHCY